MMMNMMMKKMREIKENKTSARVLKYPQPTNTYTHTHIHTRVVKRECE